MSQHETSAVEENITSAFLSGFVIFLTDVILYLEDTDSVLPLFV